MTLSTMTGAWLALSEAYGGVGALAEAIGVHPATVWRYAQGCTVPRPTARTIEALARAKHVKSPILKGLPK